jgi:polynucleotide 5'-kinase involved in rRNA processing
MRKGEEEGVFMALFNAQREFLGVGVLEEIDYTRKAIKILTPVSSEIAMIKLGRVRLDKNLKEVPVVTEENPLDFADLKRIF